MKRVAEEINTSFNKEVSLKQHIYTPCTVVYILNLLSQKSNELATPAVIARRRSKEIKCMLCCFSVLK